MGTVGWGGVGLRGGRGGVWEEGCVGRRGRGREGEGGGGRRVSLTIFQSRHENRTLQENQRDHESVLRAANHTAKGCHMEARRRLDLPKHSQKTDEPRASLSI